MGGRRPDLMMPSLRSPNQFSAMSTRRALSPDDHTGRSTSGCSPRCTAPAAGRTRWRSISQRGTRCVLGLGRRRSLVAVE